MPKGKGDRSLQRRAGDTAERGTFAIVCEGKKTETTYFDGIRRKLRLSTAKVFVEGLGADPLTVVKRAELYLNDFDQAWAVFDVEAPQPHNSLHAAIDRAKAKGVHVAVSNPCFELWLLLHFHDQSAYLNNVQVTARVKACPCGYDDKGFDFEAAWPHLTNAQQRALALATRQVRNHPQNIVDRNPWTSVHELMSFLAPTE